MKTISFAAMLLLNAAAVHATAAAMEVERFEAIVNQCAQAFDARVDRVMQRDSKDWFKSSHRRPVHIRYDVRKTDSLVSPLVGVMEIWDIWATKDEKTKEAAVATTVSFDGFAIRWEWTLTYAYQNGRWVWKSGTSDMGSRLRSSEPFDHFGRSTPLDAHKIERLAIERSPIRACIP